jgi:hypothetical protein
LLASISLSSQWVYILSKIHLTLQFCDIPDSEYSNHPKQDWF